MMEANVITALAKVQADIGGIGKKRPEGGQLGYAYRGIDAIASEAQPLFGREGIVIVPTCTTITHTNELTINGKPWVDMFVQVEWTIYGPGGISDCITATTFGIGRDNSDKALNKAATQAFKNLILRVLCIGDPQDDADRPEHQNNYTDARPAKSVDRLQAEELFEAVKALTPALKAELKTWATEHGHTLTVPALEASQATRIELDAWLNTPAPNELVPA